MKRLRAGRKVHRTLYIQHGPEPTDDDRLIGVLDDSWAPLLAHAFNAWIDEGIKDTHRHYWSVRSSFGSSWRECPCGVTQELDE